MDDLSIGDVARRTGVRPSALRYYESIGLLSAPRRVNGRRRYDEDAVQRVRVIQLAQMAGFTIAEIQTLLNGFEPDTSPTARWQLLARQKLVELDKIIAHATQMKQVLESGLSCGCLRMEECAAILEERMAEEIR